MAKKEVEEVELSLVRLAEELGRAVLGPDGREFVSNKPVAAPVGYRVPRSTVELMRDMIRREMSAAAEASGFETWEEADDFDIEDDPADPTTEYERVFDFPATDLRQPLDDVAKPASGEPRDGVPAGSGGAGTFGPSEQPGAPGGSAGPPSVPPAAK